MSEKIENLFRENKKEENERNLESYLEKNTERLFGVIQLVRHGDTDYTGVYPDVTKEGFRKVGKTGKDIKSQVLNLRELLEKSNLSLGQDLLFVSSPAPRAQATCKKIEGELKKETMKEIRVVDFLSGKKQSKNGDVVRTKKNIRPLDFNNDRVNEAEKEMMKLAGVNSREEWRLKYRQTDYDYMKADLFEERDDLMETRTQAKERIFRGLANKTKVLKRYKEKFSRIPHVVAVSHFELLNQLASEIFDLSSQESDDELLHRAEKISIYMLDLENKNKVELLIGFREKFKRVNLNLREKQFEEIDENSK